MSTTTAGRKLMAEEPVSKRPRTAKNEDQHKTSPTEAQIPTFDLTSRKRDETSSGENGFLEMYRIFQALHFRGSNNDSEDDEEDDAHHKNGDEKKISHNILSWKDIGSIYERLNTQDQESWCIENQGLPPSAKAANKELDDDNLLKPRTFLAPKIIPHKKAYCSFLVQKDKDSYQKVLEKLPIATFSSSSKSLLPVPVDDKEWTYEPCLWIFFGRNPQDKSNNNTDNLEGRGLHTDSVSHDGTWHYQLSGVKEWYLSPSCDLVRHWQQLNNVQQPTWDESTKIKVRCQEGDVLVVNTRLWFHRTVIPCQANPSVSYARDFRLPGNAGSGEEKENVDTTTMTNLDGLYARNEIEAGTIIFTENDMPDCELHRSKDNPNCEVVELEDGTSAVVSRKTIKCGEFFCVAESSDEEEEEVEEDEECEDDDGDGDSDEE